LTDVAKISAMSYCQFVDYAIYRQDAAKRRQSVFKFTHRSKVSIFIRQGRKMKKHKSPGIDNIAA